MLRIFKKVICHREGDTEVKKILIFSHAMEIGGAEKALLGLLETIDTAKYSIDLFLMRHTGELMKYIPEKINLLPEIPQYSSLAIPFTDVLKKRRFRIAYGRFVGKEKAKYTVKRLKLSADNQVNLEYSHKYTLKYMPFINDNEYDLAISFLTPHYFVSDRVKAKKKIAWIHTDYSCIDIDVQSEYKMWSKYDHIVSISEAVTNSFLKKFPTLKDKILMIENILPEDYIKKLAEAFTVKSEMPDNGTIKLLSIGRFSFQKRFDEIPAICRLIKNSGVNVTWYLIGYGGDEQLIRKKIQEQNMENEVIILGKKENAYPYIKECDFYVQPSRYEGKSIAVREAQLLGKPVIITNFETASSQLKKGYDGIIVPMGIEECAKGLVDIIKNQNMQKKLINNLKKNDYSQKKEVEKIYNLL